MTYFDEVFDRIQRATNRRTQVALAELLDIRQSSISDAKRRNSIPADWFMKLFEKFGLNPDWLKSGTGPMYLRSAMGYNQEYEGIGEESLPYDSFERGAIATVFSPKLETGKSIEDLESVGIVNIPSSYSFEGLRIIQVESSANAPFIRKGAYVGLDTTDKQPVSGEYYALNMPYEGIVLKKVFIDLQVGILQLRTDNAEYPMVSVPLADHGQYMVGKIAWVMQKF